MNLSILSTAGTIDITEFSDITATASGSSDRILNVGETHCDTNMSAKKVLPSACFVVMMCANVLESTVGKLFKLHQKKPMAFQGF